MEVLATSAPLPTPSRIFLNLESSASGRFSPLAPPDTETRPTPRFQPSPAIPCSFRLSISRIAAGSQVNASQTSPGAPATSTSMPSFMQKFRCSKKPPAIFFTSITTQSGPATRPTPAPTGHGSKPTHSTVSSEKNSTELPGAYGQRIWRIAIRTRSIESAMIWPKKSPFTRFSNSPSTRNGAHCAPTAPSVKSNSSATSLSSSTTTVRTYGQIPIYLNSTTTWLLFG